MSNNRIDKIKEYLTELNLDAFYITHIPNIRYLSGFSGSSAYIIITKENNYFFTDFRYQSQSHEQVKGFEIAVNFSPVVNIKEIMLNEKFSNVGFESTHLTIHQLNLLKESLPAINFVSVPERIEQLTMIKTAEEVSKIKKACEITDKVFDKLLEIIKPGMKESEVSAEISYWHKKYGAEKDSFDPIVASGWRGALPHGMASQKVIEAGELVTLDFGCIYEGFCSDMTRTIAVGKPKSDEMVKIYDVVLQSQLLAVNATKAGIKTRELDSIARKYINDNGYEGKFGHGLGHGLGIEVHEMPSVSQRMDLEIPASVVFTIEPGVYIEGLGGVRIEDDVFTKEGGCDVLNNSPKELIII